MDISDEDSASLFCDSSDEFLPEETVSETGSSDEGITSVKVGRRVLCPHSVKEPDFTAVKTRQQSTSNRVSAITTAVDSGSIEVSVISESSEDEDDTLRTNSNEIEGHHTISSNILKTYEISECVTQQTNLYAKQVLQSHSVTVNSRLKKWTDVSETEIEQFLGFLLWMSSNVKPRIPNYWPRNMLYHNNVKNVMSLLLQVPEKEVCIDETLVPFRGRLNFIQYVKNKLHKFGIKFFKLCLKGSYTWNMKVYCGKNVNPGVPLATSVDMSLMSGLLNEAHQILGQSTHIVGILRSNRKLNPQDVVQAKLKKGEHKAKESTAGVVVLKWKGKRDVLMLSTVHGEEEAEVQTKKGTMKKPAMIIAYNQSKSFIDLSDQMKSYSHCLRRRVKWYRKLAIELLAGSALVNAHVIY
ncbi:piggyBac transposable element-derived protein 4-like [Schistocerca americana]|uniref:piggyBac transposable element-derived protein 4-like n=1 Tax=Schistocerca americana TaxID=7009 RepID=UPI001F4FB462|nr:piggyBac transposable element-derived protein 4-like [Schistocerca americana]